MQSGQIGPPAIGAGDVRLPVGVAVADGHGEPRSLLAQSSVAFEHRLRGRLRASARGSLVTSTASAPSSGPGIAASPLRFRRSEKTLDGSTVSPRLHPGLIDLVAGQRRHPLDVEDRQPSLALQGPAGGRRGVRGTCGDHRRAVVRRVEQVAAERTDHHQRRRGDRRRGAHQQRAPAPPARAPASARAHRGRRGTRPGRSPSAACAASTAARPGARFAATRRPRAGATAGARRHSSHRSRCRRSSPASPSSSAPSA